MKDLMSSFLGTSRAQPPSNTASSPASRFAVVQALGTQLNTTFTKVKDELAKTN